MELTSFEAPPRCCACAGQPSRQIRIVRFDGSRPPGAKRFALTTTFSLPICSKCAFRITLVKAGVLLVFAALASVGVLLSKPDAPQDAVIGAGVAGLIFSLLLIASTAFEPATWFKGRFSFENAEYLRLFREANPAIPARAKPGFEDGVFLIVAAVCLIGSIGLAAIGIDLAQQRLAPGDAFLFGQTPLGFTMLDVPAVLLLMVPAFVLAMYVADRIRGLVKPAPVDSLLASVWAYLRAVAAGWRVTAAIAAVMLAVVAAAGFRCYLYATESGLSIGSPFEASPRHYRWDEVSVVFLSCRTSTKGARLRYVLRMLDGGDVDFVRVPAHRIAPALGRIASRLDSVPNVTYIFDVTEPALVAFGRDHGTRFADDIRAQVQEHGGNVGVSDR